MAQIARRRYGEVPYLSPQEGPIFLFREEALYEEAFYEEAFYEEAFCEEVVRQVGISPIVSAGIDAVR